MMERNEGMDSIWTREERKRKISGGEKGEKIKYLEGRKEGKETILTRKKRKKKGS